MTSIFFNTQDTGIDFPFAADATLSFRDDTQSAYADKVFHLEVRDLTVNRKAYGHVWLKVQHINHGDPHWSAYSDRGDRLTDSAREKVEAWAGRHAADLYDTYIEQARRLADIKTRQVLQTYTQNAIAHHEAKLAALKASLEDLNAWQALNEQGKRLDTQIAELASANDYRVIKASESDENYHWAGYHKRQAIRWWILRHNRHPETDTYQQFDDDFRVLENTWLQQFQEKGWIVPDSKTDVFLTGHQRYVVRQIVAKTFAASRLGKQDSISKADLESLDRATLLENRAYINDDVGVYRFTSRDIYTLCYIIAWYLRLPHPQQEKYHDDLLNIRSQFNHHKETSA